MGQLTTTNNNQLTETKKKVLPFNIDASDLEPGYYVIAQKMSKGPVEKMVEENKAKYGDIVDTMPWKVVGGESKAVAVIPISQKKLWERYEKVDGNKKLIERVPFGSSNANWKYEAEENGKKIENRLVMYWGLLPIFDGKPGNPVVAKFKGASFRSGKRLASLIAYSGTAFGKVYFLSTEKQTNEKGTFHIFAVAEGRDATAEESEMAEGWANALSGKNLEEVTGDEEEVPF